MFLKVSVLFRALLFVHVALKYGQAQTSLCTFTPSTTATHTSMTLEGTAVLNDAAVGGTYPSYTVDHDVIDYLGMTVERSTGAGPDIKIDFNVDLQTGTTPEQVEITLTLQNLNTSGGPITSAYMVIDIGSTLQALWGTGIPNGANLAGRSRVEYSPTNIAVDGSESINFLAEPAGDGGTDLPEGLSYFYANLYFTYLGVTYGTVVPSFCLERVTIVAESVVYEHGFTALTFFIAFFAAIGLTILGIWLFLYLRRRRRDATVSPSDEKRMRDKGKKIVMDAKEAMRRGANPIKDFSLIAWNDSLVFILALKDKLHMHREIDNLDILSTINVDTDIENEQNDAAVQASQLLIQGLVYNGDINKGSVDKANSTMQNSLRELGRKLDTDYKKDLEVVYLDFEAKNKERLGELLQQHKQKQHQAAGVVRDLPEMEKKKMMEMIDQEQHAEENELTYKLALEQNTEAEKLRKEYAIRKRIGIKEIQQQFISDVIESGDLNAEKAEWLIKQHREQQEQIHSKYDDEISRQRMNLEEKLARRRALALASETQEDDNSEMLNTIASIQLSLLSKLRRSSTMVPDQVDEYTSEVQTNLHAVKDKMNRDKEARQHELFKRLSQAKQKALAEKMSQQASELNKFVNTSKAQQTEGPVDPLSYVDGLVSLKSQHRKELCVLENQLDESQAKELEKIRTEAVQRAIDELGTLERDLIERLKSENVSDATIEKLLASHGKTVSDMNSRHLANRQRQEARLKDELARRKREWEERRVTERQEQKDLREHEAEVLEKLLSSQVAFSDQERERIIKEHEKQMVLFENSLTLNKLRQKQMLEEKIAERKARQVEQLQQKQNAELMKQRKYAENNGEEDDDDTHMKEMLLLKKHTEQRIAMRAIDIDIEAELEEVRTEMTKERALALKGQEEKLGALIASLQMTKAREMARIDEQQKAINSLKANIMDDLNSRGILSTPECEKVLRIHNEEQDKLNRKLDGQRAKQEQMLHHKLQERLAQRENSMLQQQEAEMRALLESSTNKTSATIHRLILMNKQMVEMEKFRNKMEREISQTLEETKRDFECQKQRIYQEQEMQFLAGLVRIGHFSRNELIDVLHMLFPGKTEESIMEILGKIYQEDPIHKLAKREKDASNVDKHTLKRQNSTLADRVYTEEYSNPTPFHRRGSVMTMYPPKHSETSKKMARKGSQLGMSASETFPYGYDTSDLADNTYRRSSLQQKVGPFGEFIQRSQRQGSVSEKVTSRRPSQTVVPARSDPSRISGRRSRYNDSDDDDDIGGYRRQSKGNHNGDDDEDEVKGYGRYRRQSRANHNGNDDEDEVKGYGRYRRQSKGNHNGDDDEDEVKGYGGYRRQSKVNHNGDDDDSDDASAGYGHQKRLSQSGDSNRFSDYNRRRRVNHNGDDDDDEDDVYNDYARKNSKMGSGQSQRNYPSGRLSPLRDKARPVGKKKKSMMLRKLAHHDSHE